MPRLLKVFCSGADQKKVAETGRVIEPYDAFVLLEATEENARRLAQRYPVEDITDQYTIRSDGRAIDTSQPRIAVRGRVLAHPAYKGVKPLPRGRHHYLVQFVGPIKGAWLAGVRKTGGEPRSPYADFTYVVRADESALRSIVGLPYVRWVGHLPHEHRLAPTLVAGAAKTRGAGAALPEPLPRHRALPGVYTVEFFGSDDLRRALPAVKRLEFKVLAGAGKGDVLVVAAEAPEAKRRAQLRELSAVHGVRFIRERSLKRTSNDVAAGIMGTSAALANPGLRLSGKGEVVAVCDTGLDTGDPETVHPDFAKRVAWIKSYPISAEFDPHIGNPGADDGPADVDSGHGTHVAGSVLGDGRSSEGLPGLAGPIRGLAYKARLVFQAVEQEMEWKEPFLLLKYGRYVLAGIPSDLGTLFLDAYKKKARIHSNSWGGGDPGAYDEQCAQLDRFVWEHKDFCVLVAAGNDGTDRDGDGRINPMSVSSPATAKNCITVGACENLRPSFDGEQYGDWWPKDYPVAPFRDDPMANDPRQVVAFSSRGPTLDGRVRPDVVAPGTFVLSTRSRMIAENNTAWAALPSTRLYFHMGGTSMAAPLTAGACALIREYLKKKRKIKKPTAALIKAALIAGAERLPGAAPGGTVLDNDQGYGRVNLDPILAPTAPAVARFLEFKPGLRTGEERGVDVELASSAVALRVVLAYSDFPGNALVNNLNLLVQSPAGAWLVGNPPEGGRLAPDTKNNVEAIHVSTPATGPWRVSVVASNVPQGPQDFALVILGPLA